MVEVKVEGIDVVVVEFGEVEVDSVVVVEVAVAVVVLLVVAVAVDAVEPLEIEKDSTER